MNVDHGFFVFVAERFPSFGRVLSLLVFTAILVPARAGVAAETQSPTVTLRLQNGSVLVGSIVEETPRKVRVHVEGIGEIEVDRSAIVERQVGTQETAIVPAPNAPLAKVAAPLGAALKGVKWTRTLTLGGNYASAPFRQGAIEGTTAGLTGAKLGLPGSQISTQLQATAQRTTTATDWWVGANATYATAQPRGPLANQWQIKSDFRDHFIKDWYGLSLTTLSSDRIRHIKDDFDQIFGIGHRLVDTPRNRFDLVAGVDAERSYKNTKYDGHVLEGFGVVENYHFGNDKGMGIDQGIQIKTDVQDVSLFKVQSYISVNAPLTKVLSLNVSVQSTYDRMLKLQRTDVPANAFYPGSPAGSFFATSPWSTQLTSGIQVRF